MSKHDRSVDVIDGALAKPLLLLSAPIVASQVLNVGYNLADTYWVGRLGPEAVAALSYAWPIVFLMVSVGGGLTVAGTVLVAQHKGAGSFVQSHHVAGQTLSFVTLVAAVFAAVGYVLTPWLVSVIGATPGTDPYTFAVQYTRIVFLGIAFMFWFFIFDALSRGWGDTKTPLYLMVISVALNVVLDPFLILGFSGNPVFGWVGLSGLEATLHSLTGFSGYGVTGAAIATVFSRGTAAAVGLYLLFSGSVGLEPSFDDLRPDPETIREILDIGAPTAAEQGLRGLGIAALTAIIALAGDDAVAAYGIVNRLSSLLFLPALGLARGTETVVGQNLGADQVERAKRAVYVSGVVVVSIFAVVTALAYPFAEGIVGFFLAAGGGESTESVIEIGAAYITIAGPAYLFLGVFQIALGGFRGSGSTRLAMVFSTQELWLYRIPISYALLVWVGMGVTGVWYAVAISYVLSALTTCAWFLRGTWTEGVVDRAPHPTPGD
ncbi:multidrug resistance protein MdtK [Halalkalicoccus paucihalophilus]|uniref:Multidrug-efflux transporter n=1 Tax=Halalkalicoccus paucihalophilus TaxID=1008153 RepID=A0A151AJR4_9EURY|nr:MATE family efflux transporter [Halalkalicoccus paucihalophilus]KYH27908.1 multidrug resistance protein MdtK [Halalkalicoccus paucihalophilus]